jgi:HD-like signal output (HDOD) protein
LNALTPEIDRKLGTAVERMPAFPRSVQRILELTRSINCLPRDIVAVIEKDPVMTMKIFKVINSAYYNLPNKITSVGQSVVYLGINTIKNLALGFAAAGILPRMKVEGFDVRRCAATRDPVRQGGSGSRRLLHRGSAARFRQGRFRSVPAGRIRQGA